MSDGRKNLATSTDLRMWRSLDELAATPAFEEMLHREFPENASEWLGGGTSRRSFLKVMGASLALAGLASCTRKPDEAIVPYVRQPEELIPGKPLYFASAIMWGGYGRGVLVESHEGRPTKIEGNPDHPASLGATDAVTQAALLNLYDPDRSQTVTHNGEVSSWNKFTEEINNRLEEHGKNGGEGVRILTGAITSPTLAQQMQRFQQLYPKAKWHQYEPIGRDNNKAGAHLATGEDVAAVWQFDKAKVIVSLDSNFLIDDPGSIRYARQFIDGRRVRHDKKQMNRLYVLESTPTVTGAMADHVSRVKPSQIESLARELYSAVQGAVQGTPPTNPFIAQIAKDLLANRGAGLVVAGEFQPPIVHALAHLINAQLGNVGKTMYFIDLVEASPVSKLDSLKTLVADMNSGAVKTLLILGGNPVYSSPADLDFESALARVPLRIHHASHIDETSFNCHWHLPATHELEMWSDARAYDGTACIIQPLIAPLYQGRSVHDVMAVFNGQYARTGYELIRAYWRPQAKSSEIEFDAWWTKTLNDGVVAGTASKPREVKVNAKIANIGSAPPSTQAAGSIEIAFRPDPALRDGRHANNGWLQELPRPLTRLTWDNAAFMSQKTAERLKVIDVNEAPGNSVEATLVELNLDGRRVKAPAWILPGQPDDVITVHFGFGRTASLLHVANGVGFNAYRLRNSDNPWHADGLAVTVTEETMPMACVQNHSMMEQNYGGVDRNLIHVLPAGEESTAKEKEENAQGKRVPLTIYPEYKYADSPGQGPNHGNKWGMVIDQNACIGCNACVVACQAENNIPVVGKEQVAKGREMHWLRIDTYFAGESSAEPDGPYFQPIPCMHCENAPCEVVCPVNATVHDAEGLNNQVYNRCVGTRYCSNNCPYKVRHFNFLHYTKYIGEKLAGPLELMMNPNVTVRYRGVMEKCTYCVQRINATRIEAKKDDRAIREGEVVTACQQSCPTQAIFFGNLNDPTAAVTRLTNEPENYGLLNELQTKPRTTYLPRYVNKAADKTT